MKKEILEMALYKVVTVEFKESNNKYYGWLVKDKHYKNSYCVLPINHKHENIVVFKTSAVKTITYDSNGVVLK
jgi:hypothetical protein